MSTSAATLRPPESPGPLLWIRKNLFNNWFNSILTILSLLTLYFVGGGLLRWVFFSADWTPIAEFPMLFMVGQYPRELLWRVGASLATVSLLFGLSWGIWGNLIQSFAVTLGALLGIVAVLPAQINDLTLGMRGFLIGNILLIALGFILARRIKIRGLYVAIAWVLAAGVITLILLPGFENNDFMPAVPTTKWGGFMVTLILAVGGIALSFPIGVLLAFGRRSTLPVVKAFCTTFIEVIRGVPLVTILFMFSMILQVFLPIGARFDRLLRALMGMTLFSAAYMAENVRGGLQSIPHGQIEAAKAIGMNGFQTNIFIVLPQALRAVIPAIVGQFISLFKDTTLAIILGLNELLGIGKAVINTTPVFVQLQLEIYLFIALLFWVFSFAMSFASRRLEKALGVGER